MPSEDRPVVPSLDPDTIARLRRALLRFFDAEGRDLPWRRTRDPYAIWVSEVMSQQTRLETVIPYWRAWMRSYPDVVSLAEADETAVLKAWEGLGYYSRARNLHRAARMVREHHRGVLPATSDGLRELPGVGAYTAGAVASIAYGEAVPAVDGNVRRVAARLMDWPDPPPRALYKEAARWVPDARPGDFNQALMELGATICTPRGPRCDDCPVASLCRGLEAGTVAERPAPRVRSPVRTGRERVTVAWRPRDDGVEFALRQRGPDGLLAGMYEFPGTPVDADEAAESARGGNGGLGGGELPAVPHVFSHLEMTYLPRLSRCGRDEAPPRGTRWVGSEELADLPLPVAQKTILSHATAALEGLETGPHPD